MAINDRIRARWWWRHADFLMYLPTVGGAIVWWVVDDGVLTPDELLPGSTYFVIGLALSAVIGTLYLFAGRWSSDEDDQHPAR